MLTALALCGIAKLLETRANLLGGPALTGDLEDVVRDELVAHWETVEGARGGGADWLVFFKAY